MSFRFVAAFVAALIALTGAAQAGCQGDNFFITYKGSSPFGFSLDSMGIGQIAPGVGRTAPHQERLGTGQHTIYVSTMNAANALLDVTSFIPIPFDVKECSEAHLDCTGNYLMPAQCAVSYVPMITVEDVEIFQEARFQTIETEAVPVPAGTTQAYERSESSSRQLTIEHSDSVGASLGVSIGVLTANLTGQLQSKTTERFDHSEKWTQKVSLDGRVCNLYRVSIQRRIRSGRARVVSPGGKGDWVRFSFPDGIRIVAEKCLS